MWHCVSWISTIVSSIAFERNMTYSGLNESSYIDVFSLTQIVVLLLSLTTLLGAVLLKMYLCNLSSAHLLL